jgi:hypothetical protein
MSVQYQAAFGGVYRYIVTMGNNTVIGAIDGADGSTAIGPNAPDPSAALDVQSTTKGVGVPALTTAQKLAIANPKTGLLVFDSTLAALQVYNGTAWAAA